MSDDLEHDEPPPLYDGVFTDVFAATSLPPHWIVKDFLPPGMTFLAADPKAGKSSLTMALAALVAGYQCKALPLFLSKVEQHGPVMVFSAEGTAGELRNMLEEGLGVSGSSDGGILVADDPWEFQLDEDSGTAKFLTWVNTRKPKLVIIDPLRNFHNADENDSAAMYKLLRPLRQWAVGEESALIVVHHTRKASENESAVAVERMRGTSAMFGMADGAIVMTPDKAGYTEVKAIFKRAASWHRKIRIASYANRNLIASEQLDSMDTLVLDAINAGAITWSELVEKTRIALPRVKNCVEKLVRNGWADAPLE